MKEEDPNEEKESEGDVGETQQHGDGAGQPVGRRDFLRGLGGFLFITAAVPKAWGQLEGPGGRTAGAEASPEFRALHWNPPTPSGEFGCAQPSNTGVGYAPDLGCTLLPQQGTDQSCGLLNNHPSGGGAGGGAWGDSDCGIQGVGWSNSDEDCGRNAAPINTGHKDNECGLGVVPSDEDCGIGLGPGTVNSDSDCHVTAMDNGCNLGPVDIGFPEDPLPGLDPECLHSDSTPSP